MPKTAIFETNIGTITAELYETDAPLAVANLEKLANDKFYDGVKFHRVIPDFVVQGGDPFPAISRPATRASAPEAQAGPSRAKPRATRAPTRWAHSRWRTPARIRVAASSSWY